MVCTRHIGDWVTVGVRCKACLGKVCSVCVFVGVVWCSVGGGKVPSLQPSVRCMCALKEYSSHFVYMPSWFEVCWAYCCDGQGQLRLSEVCVRRGCSGGDVIGWVVQVCGRGLWVGLGFEEAGDALASGWRLRVVVHPSAKKGEVAMTRRCGGGCGGVCFRKNLVGGCGGGGWWCCCCRWREVVMMALVTGHSSELSIGLRGGLGEVGGDRGMVVGGCDSATRGRECVLGP